MTIDQFGKALVASGLMTADDVKATWNAIPPESRPKDGATFGKLLVDKGLLTPFQAAEIVAGRGARLMMGDYTIVSQIGAGGMGQVYKAQHRRMKRVVALKVMSNAAMQDEAAVKRFQREVHAAARLEHPNIVTAYDSGEAGSVKYLVMQFVDGGDLSDLVKKTGRLEIAQAVGYVIQAARGLAFAHGEGVIHRDIKPANLLLDKKGIVKILDMGLARFEDGGDGLTATEQVMGTVDYMSPEQAANTKGCDGRADIYSLGCTLWYLLTGKKLYEADTLIARLMLHRDGPLPSLVKERDDAPWPLEQALHKMIAKRAADRYQTMDEVVAALAPFGGDASLSGSLGGSGTSGGQSAELASFMQAMGSGGTKTSHPSATQMKAATAKPATSANLEATAQLSTADVGTDPKSQVLPKGTPTAQAQPQPKRKKPGNDKTKLIAAGALGGLLLLAGIIVLIRNKDGEVVAEIKVPEGGKVEVVTAPQSTSVMPVQTTAASPKVMQLLESPDYIWTTPENLGTPVNGSSDENVLSVTGDFLRLFFDRKAGADGKRRELCEAVRTSPESPFGEPRVVGIAAEEAFVSYDGLSVAGGNPMLYWLRRPSFDAPFAPADDLEIFKNTNIRGRAPTISFDGLTLIFESSRDQQTEKTNLYISQRRSQKEKFSFATKLGPAINSLQYERRGMLSADASTIIFLRDAWHMTTSRSDGKTMSIPLPENPFGNTPNLWIAPDGRTAYFSADRPGGLGGRDVYVTRRVPKSGATSPAIAATPAATPSFMQSLPTTVPPGVQNLPAGKWGLRFEPGQFVEAGPAPYRDTTVVTTELWLTDESDPSANQSTLVGGPNGYIHTSQNDRVSMYTPHRGNPEPVAMPKNQRVHIAAVNDGRGRRLYVNGKLAASSDDAGSPTSGNRDKSLPIEISNKHRFRGVIDGVRISTTARYTADFTPDQTFTADKDTFAVYRFDEGQGNVLKDSSANGYHGRINGATWVRGGASVPPPAPATPSVSATSSLADSWPFDSADGKQYAWSTPENLGPAINTQGRNLLLGISDDELTIYLGGENLRTARRSSPQESFGPPGPIPGLSDRCKGVISSNGLAAAFAEFRTAERAPVWLSARSSVDQPFSPPVKAEPPASDSNNGEGRALSPDGLTLAVNSNRNRGSADIWIFRRPALDQPFGSAERLAEPVSTPDWDIPYFISNDRCFLIAASQRGTGGSAERIVRYFRRAAENEPFGPGTEIELPLGSAKRSDSNGDFRLADGGRALYFSSYAVNGGHGDFDVWVCRRVSASGRPLVPSKPEDLRRLLDAKFEVVVRTPSPFGAEAIDSKLKSGDALPTGPATIVGLALGGTATPIDDALLGFVAGLTELEELRFEKGTHSFSAQGLRKLASLTQLRRLSLYNVGRHADGASDLLASLPHLEFLHIPYGTQIAGEWAAAAAVRPSIIEINAFRADFSDTGISPLEKMPQLQRLNLSDNAKLTQGAIDRLVAALPSCRIEYGSHSDKKIIEPRSSPAKAAAPPPGAPAVMQNGPPPAVFPFDAAAAMKHQEAWAKHLGVPVEFTNGVGMKFRLIPPGEFQMGLGPEFTDEELLRLNRGKDDQKLRGLRMARPAHPVRITRPFYMEVEEVTAGRYRDVVGQLRPEMEQDPNKVLGNLVAWPDAIAFCNKLSEREGKRPAYRIEGAQVTPVDDADGYRLPTEAQWEYACRAGTNTLWYFGSDGGADSNEFRKRCAAPNPFGLTGLYGGANEWCWDATHGNPYRAASVDRRDDPREDVGTSRIKRGGSGNDDSGGNRGAINSFVRIGTPGGPYGPDASRYTGFGRVVLPITAIARP